MTMSSLSLRDKGHSPSSRASSFLRFSCLSSPWQLCSSWDAVTDRNATAAILGLTTMGISRIFLHVIFFSSSWQTHVSVVKQHQQGLAYKPPEKPNIDSVAITSQKSHKSLKNCNYLYMRYGERYEATTQGHPLLTSTHAPCHRPSQTCRSRASGRAGLHCGAKGAQQPCQPPPGGIIPGPWGLCHHPHRPRSALPTNLEHLSCYCPQKSDSLPKCATSQQLHTQERDLIICFTVAQAWMIGGILQTKDAPQDFQAIIYTNLFSTSNLQHVTVFHIYLCPKLLLCLRPYNQGREPEWEVSQAF